MQAIILAAGMGRRLGDYTKENTKCMIPVNGVRLIDRVLTYLLHLDINRVVIVVGYQRQNLINHVGNIYHNKLKIEYIENPVYDKTNNIYSLYLAKDVLAADDTILLESDLIYEECILKMLVDAPDSNLALVAKYESWMDGTVVKIDEGNNIVNFIPKKAFNYDEVDQYYKTVNIYKFSREFSRNKYIPFLEAYCKALGNNEYYEQVLRVITLLDNSDLKALPIGEKKWYEIDDIQDLDIAETIFSPADEMYSRIGHRFGGFWRFPKMLDFCYLVNPYFPPRGMMDEMKANFDALLKQYPSGMSVNSLLAGKYFGVKKEYIVVGNGASELIKSFIQNKSMKLGFVYPTFEEYPNRLSKQNIVYFEPQNNDYSYSLKDLKQFFEGRQINALLLINPDNPSGNYIPLYDILEFAEWCRHRSIRLIVDESFVDFTDNFEYNTLLKNNILEQNENLVVIKSISKSYGVPGLRLGILASSDENLIRWMKKDISIWNINSFAEFYMQIFSKYSSEYNEACKKFIVERKRFYNKLNQVSYIRVIPSQANYFLCEITDRYTSSELAELLLSNYNILIKDCNTKHGLEGKNYIRLSIRDKHDDDTLVSALLNL